MERRQRAADTREEKRLSKKERFSVQAPPLLVSMAEDTGKLPVGISIQFPHNVGIALIHRGLDVAIPVGSFAVRPDLVVDDEDMKHVGFDVRSVATAAAV